jgi:hypothetical protein
LPGSFAELAIDEVVRLEDRASIVLEGPGTLAYDGERERILAPGTTATITVRADGPRIVDVDRTLHCAARRQLFDVPPTAPVAAAQKLMIEETPHGN